MKKSTRVFFFIFVDFLIVIVGALYFLKNSNFFASNIAPAQVITQAPSITHLSLGAGEQAGDYTMYSLPGDLAQAKINDIVFDAGALWMGTKKGLVKIKGSQVTVYKQFSNLAIGRLNGLGMWL